MKTLTILGLKSNACLKFRQGCFLLQSRPLVNGYFTTEDLTNSNDDSDYFGVVYYSSIRQKEQEIAKENWLKSLEKPDKQDDVLDKKGEIKQSKQTEPYESKLVKKLIRRTNEPRVPLENIVIKNYGHIRYDRKMPDEVLEQKSRMQKIKKDSRKGETEVHDNIPVPSMINSNRLSRISGKSVRQSIRRSGQTYDITKNISHFSVLNNNRLAKQQRSQIIEKDNKTGLSFIDDQYFKNEGPNEQFCTISKSVKQSESIQDESLTKDMPDSVRQEDLSFIDQQYFMKNPDVQDEYIATRRKEIGSSAIKTSRSKVSYLNDKHEILSDQKENQDKRMIRPARNEIARKKNDNFGKGGNSQTLDFHGSDFIDEQYFGYKPDFHDEEETEMKVRDIIKEKEEDQQMEVKKDQVASAKQYLDNETNVSHIKGGKATHATGSNMNKCRLFEERQSSNLILEKMKKKVFKQPESAEEVAMQKRAELEEESGRRLFGRINAKKLDTQGFRILSGQVPDFTSVPSVEIADLLRKNILYNSDDIVAINKPYGLSSSKGAGTRVSVEHLLGDLLPSTKLYLVSGIGKETTGILLLAKTLKMAEQLQQALVKEDTIKRYLVITKNVPKLPKGEINIPIGEGKVDGKVRKNLRPYGDSEMGIPSKLSKSAERAVTRYEVLSKQDWCALLECLPLTNVKHQIRVHLAFGLNCPILGDHKYSHFDKIAPMKLHADLLNKLHVRQSKVRHIAMHIHARAIIIPEFLDGRNLLISAPLPPHFIKNLKTLNLKMPPKK